MDKNNNRIPDKLEIITTYTIACSCIILAIAGYFLKDMDTVTVRWLLGFAVFLSGERDLGDFLRK